MPQDGDDFDRHRYGFVGVRTVADTGRSRREPNGRHRRGQITTVLAVFLRGHAMVHREYRENRSGGHHLLQFVG